LPANIEPAYDGVPLNCRCELVSRLVHLTAANQVHNISYATFGRTKPMTPSRDIARLVEIMAALRDKDTGCPWDLEQSFATIAPYTIEESARGRRGDRSR